MQRKRLVFPFSAIVGLEKLKLAILINAINPKIGGLLIKGPKGCGKTTIVRSLSDILPKIKVVKGCPFNCNPDDPSNMCPTCNEKYREDEKMLVEERGMVVVDLPLGATEDRVIGGLDVEKAIKHGIEALEPGILAEANQNVLYVDEVNLLPDHIADDLLDAAATGWNVVEREGISVSHPSRFLFVGTMNPEEGELRPQLLDRFPMSVSVGSIASVGDRVEIVKRNIQFETDPEKFYDDFRQSQEELRNKIAQAKTMLGKVILPEGLLKSISQACLDLKVDGLRPDIIIAKATITLVAFENRTEATLDDVLVAAELALSHRTREGGFLEPATSQEIFDTFTASAKKLYRFEKTGETTKEDVNKRTRLFGKTALWVKKDAREDEEKHAQNCKRVNKIKKIDFRIRNLIASLTGGMWGKGRRLDKTPKDAPVGDGLQKGDTLKGQTYEDKTVPEKSKRKAYPTVGEAAHPAGVTQGYTLLSNIKNRVVSPSEFFLRMGGIKTRSRSVYAGRHAHAVTTLNRGRPYGWKLPHGKPADIHIPATIRQAARRSGSREKPVETILKIAVEDIREKLRSDKVPLTMMFVVDLSGSMLLNLEAVREALLKLHGDAYRCRDRVGIVALKDLSAVVVQHPITNLRVVASKLVSMRVSGFTPLATGMYKALEVLKEARRMDPSTTPVMVVVTDGSANVPLKKSLETGQIRQIDETLVAVREYEDIATEDVFAVSKIVRREGIHVITINTNSRMYGRETYGVRVTEQIAHITNGTHHAIGLLRNKTEMIGTMIEDIKEDQRTIISQEKAE